MKKTFTLIAILVTIVWLNPVYSGIAPDDRTEKIKTIMIRYGLFPQPDLTKKNHPLIRTLTEQSGRDENTMVQQILTQDWKEGGWTNTELETFTYNNDENVQNIQLQVWEGNAWINSFKVDYVYGTDSQVSQNIYSMWDAVADAWQVYGRSTPAYDPVTQLLIHILVETYSPSDEWMNATLSYFNYNDRYLVSQYSEDAWDPDNLAWEQDIIHYYTYNNEDQLTEDYKQYWWGNEYLDSYKETYGYNEQGQMTQKFFNYFWFPDWFPGSISTYIYNAEGYQIHELEEAYDLTTWYYNFFTTYMYDENGNLISELLQTWDGNSSWENYNMRTYTYSSPTGIHESMPDQTAIEVYPNPASSEVHFSLTNHQGTKARLAIFDTKGAMIRGSDLPKSLVDGKMTWTVPASVKSGIYMYNLKTETGSFTGQFIINR